MTAEERTIAREAVARERRTIMRRAIVCLLVALGIVLALVNWPWEHNGNSVVLGVLAAALVVYALFTAAHAPDRDDVRLGRWPGGGQ